VAGRLLFGGFPVDFPLDIAVVRSWADADAADPPDADDEPSTDG
jgi:DNA polymerase-1